MKRHLERFRTTGTQPLQAHSARREGADGSVALATVFSGALGFKIRGVSLMPLRLALVATKIGGGSTEIAMIMIAPSATPGFGKSVPEIVT
jgi:hypothetical protein